MNRDSQLIFETYIGKHAKLQPKLYISPMGKKIWTSDGTLDGIWGREDGPAYTTEEGNIVWWFMDQRYPSPQAWAKAILNYYDKPAEPEDVAVYLRPILQKQTKEMI